MGQEGTTMAKAQDGGAQCSPPPPPPPTRGDPTFQLFGPVVMDSTDERFQGAEVKTNNAAELTGIIEALMWLREEAPRDKTTPVAFYYDSQYAADSIRGLTSPYTTRSSFNRASITTKSAGRKITWHWVKGHEGTHGNEVADRLAHKGSQGEIGKHSRRWAAPHAQALTVETAETCRKCGRVFRSARKCGAHEKTCEGQSELTEDQQQCRKCGETLKDRKARAIHEPQCTGDVQKKQGAPILQKGVRVHGQTHQPRGGLHSAPNTGRRGLAHLGMYVWMATDQLERPRRTTA